MNHLFFFLSLSILIGGCCKDHSDIVPGQDFIPDEILEAIEENGQVIYEGFDPPALEGKYLLSPSILQHSNFDDLYVPGHQFFDVIVEFREFNPNDLTIKVSISDGGTITGEGFGSFVSGDGDNFTVYVKLDLEDSFGHKLLQADVYSGTLEPDGIRNFQRSLFMIDDFGDPSEMYIENGHGRLFEDGDGFSEEI